MIFTLTFLVALITQPIPAQVSAIHDEPLTLPALVYPDEAKKARIEGTVQLQINVDATGHVTAVYALGGPVPLRQAAVDAYSQAVYRPILVKGVPAPAIITTSVRFKLTELPMNTDEQIGAQFKLLQAECQGLAEQKAPQALASCRQALDTASHFTMATFDLEAHATAYNDVVLLLIADGKRSKQLPEAGVLASQAVDLVNLTVHNNPHTPAVAVAYITRCEVRSLAEDLRGAAADCAVAEETLTTLLQDYPENDRSANYRVQLRETLQLHAIIADRDHHLLEARRLKQRAAAI